MAVTSVCFEYRPCCVCLSVAAVDVAAPLKNTLRGRQQSAMLQHSVKHHAHTLLQILTVGSHMPRGFRSYCREAASGRTAWGVTRRGPERQRPIPPLPPHPPLPPLAGRRDKKEQPLPASHLHPPPSSPLPKCRTVPTPSSRPASPTSTPRLPPRLAPPPLASTFTLGTSPPPLVAVERRRNQGGKKRSALTI